MQPSLSPSNIRIDIVPRFDESGIELAVLRLDLIHPVISGNKWFKLRYYLEDAKAQQKKQIVTFGGAWSNHIIATAAACRLNGLSATGIIRGEEPLELSSTLQQAKEWGMKLIFISRSSYSGKMLPPELENDDNYIIPEGGYGSLGVRGASFILEHCPPGFTHYCCAAGTGTMMTGLINASHPGQIVIGISVLKNNKQLAGNIESLIIPGKDPVKWELNHDYHFGGYAKYEPRLLQFMNDFYTKTAIPSDFVYTGKLFYAVNDMIENGFFPPASKILMIHSGGLQGNLSLRKGTLNFPLAP